MSARTELADYLDELLPEGYPVRRTFDLPDEVEAGTHPLIMWSAAVRPGASIGLRQYEVVVWLISSLTDPELVDDDLDVALAIVLDALDKAPRLRFTEAERGTLDDVFPGYRITLTTQHRK